MRFSLRNSATETRPYARARGLQLVRARAEKAADAVSVRSARRSQRRTRSGQKTIIVIVTDNSWRGAGLNSIFCARAIA